MIYSRKGDCTNHQQLLSRRTKKATKLTSSFAFQLQAGSKCLFPSLYFLLLSAGRVPQPWLLSSSEITQKRKCIKRLLFQFLFLEQFPLISCCHKATGAVSQLFIKAVSFWGAPAIAHCDQEPLSSSGEHGAVALGSTDDNCFVFNIYISRSK